MTLVHQSSSLAKTATVSEVFVDIDQHTGFMAPNPPPDRLPQDWENWEIILDMAVKSKLQVGDKLGLSDEERAISKRWREAVRAVGTTPLLMSITSRFLFPFHSYLRYLLLDYWVPLSFFDVRILCWPTSYIFMCRLSHRQTLCPYLARSPSLSSVSRRSWISLLCLHTPTLSCTTGNSNRNPSLEMSFQS